MPHLQGHGKYPGDSGARRRLVSVGGRPVNLTLTEFDLLAEMMSAPGRVFTRAGLLKAVQGVSLDSMERSINVHIRNLRVKIEPNPSRPRYIETVFGVGYRFCADAPSAKE